MVLKTWSLLRQSIRNPQWIRTGCPQGHKGLGTSFNTDSMCQRCIFLNILFWGTFCVVVSVKLPTIHIFFDRPIIVQPDCVSIRFSSTEHGHPWLLSWTFIALQTSKADMEQAWLWWFHQDQTASPAPTWIYPPFSRQKLQGSRLSRQWWLWFPQASEDEKILVKNQVTQINWNPMRTCFRLVKWFQFVEHIPHYAPKCHWKMVKLLRNHGMRGSLIFKSKSILAKTFWKIIRRWWFFKTLIPPIYNNNSIDFGSGDRNFMKFPWPLRFPGRSTPSTRSTGQSSGGSAGAPVPWRCGWWYLVGRKWCIYYIYVDFS